MKWQVRELTNIIKKNKKAIIIIFLLIVVINILNVIAPYLLKLIIDQFPTNIVIKTITILAVIYIVVRISIVIVHAIKNRLTNRLSNNMLNELRDKIFNKVLTMKLKDFDKFPSSDIYTRLTVDAENVKTLFSDNIPVILNDIMHILFIIVVMFVISFKLAIIGFITILSIAIYSYVIVRKLKKIQKVTIKKRDLENRQFSESYNKSKLTKLFSLEKKNIEKVDKLLDEELENRKKYINVNTLLWPVGVFLESVGMYAILYYVLNIQTGISLGTVYIFLYYIKQCFSPLKEMFEQIEEIQNAQVSLERIDTILKIKEKEDIEKGLHISKLRGNIKFEDVTFAYENKEILKGVSFEIKEGEKVAIIGKTGAGKTTLSSILMRLYPIKQGKVLVDGHQIEEISIKSIRENITYISQNTYVLKDTLRNNILLEMQNIPDEKILDIMKKIGAMPLLKRLENGLDEVININRLSKGELQIIAFIRAIIHEANIYIFDEPTSNVDLRTEKMIQSIIDKISEKSTVIIIAHRLATIQNVDKILELKDGKVK